MKRVDSAKRDDKVWIFNVGTNRFEENPKWLFLYINKFRKDIDAYWFCNSNDLVKKLRSQGFKSYLFEDKAGIDIMKNAGVFVANQVKEVIPEHLRGAKYLNLWHGVGTKKYIERKLTFGDLAKRLAKKYIQYNETFINDQVFLTTSERMEEHFKTTLGLRTDQIIKAGYPRCNYIGKFEYSSYDNDFRKLKGLNADTKVVLVAPTYRDKSNIDYMSVAFPDMDKLVKRLKQKNVLMILKMHPRIEKSSGFLNAKEKYSSCPNLLFWDNELDIYEMFDQIDMAVIDYSSIYYDLIGAGVNRFVRYIFDFDIYEEFSEDYLNMTTGKICYNFDEFLKAIEFESTIDFEDLKKIKHEFWSYDCDDSFERIIEAALNYKQRGEELPTLYSFDIFDTLIARKVLEPRGVFYYVKDKISKSELEFSVFLKENYVDIRRKCESNVREYYKKSIGLRNSINIEIKFTEIFDRMKKVYNLTDEQISYLMKLELECEYENVIPMHENIEKLKKLVRNGEDVILISDMYLPKTEIEKLLSIADAELINLPLYMSSEIGVQKSTSNLYLHIYNELNYKYKEWVHFGDNKHADGKQSAAIGIKPKIHEIWAFDKFEKYLVNNIKNYDSFLVARMMAAFRNSDATISQIFVYRYYSFVVIPYIDWVLKAAIKNGTECLYFIARDGYYLKIVADSIIKIKNYKVKTKYIYGSRKAWRVPSFIEKVEKDFYSSHGNFTGVKTYEQLLYALSIDDKEFEKVLPELLYVKEFKVISDDELKKIVNICEHSSNYNKYIMEVARDKRIVMQKYINQEIDFNEKFAFVEYWARGYTQTCLTNVINSLPNMNIKTEFYYVRSIYKTVENDIRYNYTANDGSLLDIEYIFGNVPHSSVLGYKYNLDKVEPIIDEYKEVSQFHYDIISILPKACEDFYKLKLLDSDSTLRALYDATLSYINQSKKLKKSEIFMKENNAETLWGDLSTEVVPFTWADVFDRLRGKHFKDKTRSVEASLQKSSKTVQRMYYFKKNLRKTRNKIKKQIKRKRKSK